MVPHARPGRGSTQPFGLISSWNPASHRRCSSSRSACNAGPKNIPSSNARRSNDIASWRSPVLLVQGDDDRNVPFQQSVDLAGALRERGVTVEHLIFPDEVHDFLVQAHWIAAYRAATDFLERNLKK